MMQMEGRVAIITGAGSGIGRAIALGLAGEGAAVAVADIELDRAQEVAVEIEAAGGRAIAVASDVSQTAQVDAMVDETEKRFGRLDILVNNAGRAARGWVTTMTDEDWDAVMATNVRGTFLCSRAALQHMIPQRYGRIVNTASGAGLRAFPGAAVYGASKAAIINFTMSLAQEVARYGITVNAIGPGVTDTPFWRAFQTPEQVEEALKAGGVGRPEDFVPVVVFLCSEGGGVHTGLMINRETHMPEAPR